MIRFDQLGGRARRRHLRWLRRHTVGAPYWEYHGCSHVRGEDSFRIAERLHKAGLLTAAASKGNWAGLSTRPFRELALFLDERLARSRYPRTVLPRR